MGIFNRGRLPYLPSADIDVHGKKGLVSVVLPVYNGEKYLAEAIESVLAQTYKNLELIIVDDGSADSSPKIAARYADIDGRIKIIRQSNRKLPNALNTGFAAAQGEFYTWTSDDNTMLPMCIERLVDALKGDRSADVVYANMYLTDEAGKRIKGHGWFEVPPYSGRVALPRSVKMLNVVANNTVGAAFMYRAAVDAVLGGYDEKMFLLEDYDYFMRANSLFHIKHIKSAEAIYEYRFHEGSLTAHDKELGITESRPRLMELDKKRRSLYEKPILFAAEGSLPLCERALNAAGLFKADSADVSLDEYRIKKEKNGYISLCKGKNICTVKNEAAAAKLVRLCAVCDLAKKAL